MNICALIFLFFYLPSYSFEYVLTSLLSQIKAGPECRQQKLTTKSLAKENTKVIQTLRTKLENPKEQIRNTGNT